MNKNLVEITEFIQNICDDDTIFLTGISISWMSFMNGCGETIVLSPYKDNGKIIIMNDQDEV